MNPATSSEAHEAPVASKVASKGTSKGKGTKNKYDYPNILATLRSNPGRWGLVDTSGAPTNLVNRLRMDFALEAKTRRLADGSVGTWAKWPVRSSLSDADRRLEAIQMAEAGESTADVEWTPPVRQGRGGIPPLFNYDSIVAKLRGRPGQWIYVGEVNKNGRVSVGISLRADGRNCEVVTRKVVGKTPDNERYRIWARLPADYKPSPEDFVLESTDEDEWSNPPVRQVASVPPTFDYVGVCIALQSEAGQWAKVWESGRKAADSLVRWFSANGFDTATRRVVPDEDKSPDRARKVASGDDFGISVWVRWPSNPNPEKARKVKALIEGSNGNADAEVEFGPLPSQGDSRVSRYQDAVNELKTRPGQWAFMGEFHKDVFTTVYHGLVRRGCEGTTRVAADGEVRGIWARWPRG